MSLIEKYSIIRTGGSIGNAERRIICSGLDKSEAMEKAKRLRKNLSTGEKRYYKISYHVVKVK